MFSINKQVNLNVIAAETQHILNYKILIFGLPGSGKTTLAKHLSKSLNAKWLNADQVRKKFKNWDFSKKGILKQARRMKKISQMERKKISVVDFVCPYDKGRKIFNADYLIWMNTIKIIS